MDKAGWLSESRMEASDLLVVVMYVCVHTGGFVLEESALGSRPPGGSLVPGER